MACVYRIGSRQRQRPVFFLLKRQGETPQEGDPVRIAAILMSAEVHFLGRRLGRGKTGCAGRQGAALSEYPYEQRSETITDLVETGDFGRGGRDFAPRSRHA